MPDPQPNVPSPNDPPDHLPVPPGGWIELPEPERGFDPLGPPPPGPYGYGGAPPAAASWLPLGSKPRSNMTTAVLVTLLCCLPVGIVSVVYAAKVDSRWNAGDWHGAERAARLSRTWSYVAIVGGLLFNVYLLILLGTADPADLERY